MAQENKICQHCGEKGHSKSYCPTRPRSAIRKVGKITSQWSNYRKGWFKRHPGPYYCFYCLIEYEGQEIPELAITEVTLDHFMPRSGATGLRFVDSNMRVSCYFHNGDKGSVHGPHYIEKIKERRNKGRLRMM